MDDEGMRHGPSKCPDCGATPTSAWIDPGKCEDCGRTMNPSQHTNISFKPKSNDRAFQAGWALIKEKEDPCWEGYEQVGMKDKGGRQVPNCVPKKKKIKKSSFFCDCPSCELLTKALLKGKKKDDKPFHGYNPNKHSRKGGLNAKGRAKAKREEGANLKPPVTESKPTGKRKARKKSFCARMGGVKGPTSKGGKLTPKGAALKRWKC